MPDQEHKNLDPLPDSFEPIETVMLYNDINCSR